LLTEENRVIMVEKKGTNALFFVEGAKGLRNAQGDWLK
jgi:hypothetical protein